MKAYRIKEFSRRSGISPDTLRYYEKIGIFCAGRQKENSYRSYTDQDVIEVAQLRFLRGVGAPLADLQPLRSPHDPNQVMEQLLREEKDIEEELSVLTARLERVRRLTGELRECLEKEGICHRTTYPAMYSLYLTEEEVSDEAAAIISQWMSTMPYVHVSFRIPEEEVDLRPGARMRAQIGYGILASYARELGLSHTPPVLSSEPMEGVRCILTVKDPFFPEADELLPFTSYLEENHLHPVGPWHYRLRFISSPPGEERRYFIAMRVQTEKKIEEKEIEEKEIEEKGIEEKEIQEKEIEEKEEQKNPVLRSRPWDDIPKDDILKEEELR